MAFYCLDYLRILDAGVVQRSAHFLVTQPPLNADQFPASLQQVAGTGMSQLVRVDLGAKRPALVLEDTADVVIGEAVLPPTVAPGDEDGVRRAERATGLQIPVKGLCSLGEQWYPAFFAALAFPDHGYPFVSQQILQAEGSRFPRPQAGAIHERNQCQISLSGRRVCPFTKPGQKRLNGVRRYDLR